MADIIKSRRDTAENWTSANPILSDGELGFETDTKRFKLGDGKKAWNNLDYFDRDIDNYYCPLKNFEAAPKLGLAPIAGVSPFSLVCVDQNIKLKLWVKVHIFSDSRAMDS